MFKKNEKGALVVEASIVFPVMFLVIFFMIYTGNVYLQKCHVESIVTQCAIDGAAYCADPLLTKVDAAVEKGSKGNGIPGASKHEVYPYRFFSDKGAGNVESTVKTKIKDGIAKMGTGLFAGMKPDVVSIKPDYKASFLYATFSVDVNYKIRMPIRLLGQKDHTYFQGRVHVEMPVTDTVEMIRNIDMAWDYMERTGAAAKIEELGEAVKKWLNG